MRRKTWQRWASAAVAALVMASGGAHAQVPGKPSPAETEADTKKRLDQADRHYNAGNAAADLKQWKKAEEEYLKAYALSPLPQILGALGEAELRLGKPRDAAEHLARFLVEDKGAGSEERATATTLLAEAKKEIVTLKITVTEAGAEVLIDDKPVGLAPLPEEVYVTPGKHTVVARLGAARDEVTDTYEKGWTRVMRLKPKEPKADVVPTATGATAEPTVKPVAKETGGPRKEIVIGGGALAGAALVAGAVFAGLSASKSKEADDLGGWDKCYDGTGRHAGCDQLNGLHNEMAVFGNLSTGMFVGGAILGGFTALYALRILPPGSQPKSGTAAVTPVFGPAGGGLSMTGHF